MTRAGIDVAFSGTQKCLNCPPGLAPLTAGPRAIERLEARRSPVSSWCFDVPAILAYWSAGPGGGRPYHHTPPVNTIYALRDALRIVTDEGLEARWDRHRVASRALVAGLEVLGIAPLVDQEEHRLWPLTTALPGPAIDEAATRGRLLAEHGIEISGGLGELKKRAWRIGTMGVNASPESVDELIAAIAAIVEPGLLAEARQGAAAAWS